MREQKFAMEWHIFYPKARRILPFSALRSLPRKAKPLAVKRVEKRQKTAPGSHRSALNAVFLRRVSRIGIKSLQFVPCVKKECSPINATGKVNSHCFFLWLSAKNGHPCRDAPWRVRAGEAAPSPLPLWGSAFEWRCVPRWMPCHACHWATKNGRWDAAVWGYRVGEITSWRLFRSC